MSNPTPPIDNDEAANGPVGSTPEGAADEREVSATGDVDAPVFDNVAAEHPEVQDAAPELIEPTPAADPGELRVPPAGAATPEPTTVVPQSAAPAQDAPIETAESAGYDEHIDEPRTAEPTPPAAAAPSMQRVYVAAPVAPKNKGNRAFGLSLGLLALIVFAVLFVVVMAIALYATFSGDLVDRLIGFVSSTAFIVPLAVFIVAFAILVLLTNRAGWWAYVLGSFLVALTVYFGSIGVVLLTGNVFGMTADAAAASFWSLAASPSIILAGILAREVTIWFGAAIAARGRKVRERNLEARAAYERELDNQPLGFS